MSINSRSRIVALDGIRAVAIILVFMGHGSEAYLANAKAIWMAPFVNASLGVRLFFVLSGYLITRLLMHEQQARGKIDLAAFYVRRFLRIWPAIYTYLAVIAVLSAAGWISVSASQLFAAGSFSWNYSGLWLNSVNGNGWWFLGHLWTLALEQQFYLFWPFIIVFLGWNNARRFALIVPLLMPLIRIGVYFAFPGQRGFLGMMFHTAIDSILIGCAVAIHQDRIQTWLNTKPWVFWAALGFVFVVSPLLGSLISPYRITVGYGLDAVCSGILILTAAQQNPWSRWLSVRPLIFLGTLSYGLYIWQQLFLTPMNTTLTGQFPLSVIATILCAFLSYRFIETPCLRLKDVFQRATL